MCSPWGSSVGSVFLFSNHHSLAGNKELVAASLMQEIREKIMAAEFQDVLATYDGIDTDLEETAPEEARAWADHVQEQLKPGWRGEVDIKTTDFGGGNIDEGRRRGEQGSSLLVALLILGALSLLGGSLVLSSVEDRTVTRYVRHSMEALGVAETGIAYAQLHIQDLRADGRL